MEKWSNGKIKHPIPDEIKEYISQKEWDELPSYQRYKFRKRGTLFDTRKGTHLDQRRPMPEFLKGTYTEEEFQSFNVYKRYHLAHPDVTEKDAKTRQNKKFKDLEAWDLQQFATKLKRTFNITVAQYNELLDKQNGLCAICKKPERITYKKEVAMGKFIDTPRRLSVDHEHDTGKIRGLLCFDCNKRLHSSNEDGFIWIKKAVVYLERAEGEKN